jgi:hypothetical protein
MLIQSGSAETLLDDAVVRVTLEIWPDTIHACTADRSTRPSVHRRRLSMIPATSRIRPKSTATIAVDAMIRGERQHGHGETHTA